MFCQFYQFLISMLICRRHNVDEMLTESEVQHVAPRMPEFQLPLSYSDYSKTVELDNFSHC